MKIIENEGNILKSDAPLLCQSVNCMGMIGGGISHQFISKEPKIVDDYISMFSSPSINGESLHVDVKREDLLGTVIFTKGDSNKTYASVFTQVYPNDCRVYNSVSYGAMKDGLKMIKGYAEHHKPYIDKIAIPKSFGGLCDKDWKPVMSIINDVFDNYNGTVEVWSYGKN